MSFWTGTHWERDTPAPSAAARPSRRRHTFEAIAEGGMIALLVVGLVAGTTFAAKGGGSLQATISMESSARLAAVSGDHLSFQVTRSIPDNDPVMWVSTKCYDQAGARVSWLDLPVLWGTSTSLNGTAGAYEVSGAWCEAYATLRPWRSQVLSGAYVRFDVGS